MSDNKEKSFPKVSLNCDVGINGNRAESIEKIRIF